MVQDFEQNELNIKKANELKRKKRENFGYGAGEDISDIDDDDAQGNAMKNQAFKKKFREHTGTHMKQADVAKLQG